MGREWPENGLCDSRYDQHDKTLPSYDHPSAVTTLRVQNREDNPSQLDNISSESNTMELEHQPQSMDLSDVPMTNHSMDNHHSDKLKRKSECSPEASKGPPEKKQKSPSASDSSRSPYRDDRFVYGNPKETIKPPQAPDLFETSNVLDLSCKGTRPEGEKTKTESTYHNFHRNNHPYLPDPFQRSNLEIKLVNTPRRPSTTEQLQIAKLQQQQRRSVQQQQKMLQQMRRSLDSGSGRPSASEGQKKSHREERPDVPKEEFHPSAMGGMFPPPPYYDPAPSKELPDGHPILPLLDPVYFSALYNAHGFMPPSSPSIAAAFINTLQETLPKLSLMFPPNQSSSSSSLMPQKSNENQ